MSTAELFDVDAPESGEIAAPPAGEQETQGTPQPAPAPIERTVPLKALESERQRRQEAERQNAALIEAINRVTPQQQQPSGEQQKYSELLFTDTDRFLNDLFGEVNARINAVQERSWQEKTAALEEAARDTKPDYDEMLNGYFYPAMQQDPTLYQRMRAAPNAALFAYREAKRLKAASELGGDLDVAKLKEKLRAELMAELEGKKKELQNEIERLPASLGTLGAGAPPTRATPTKNGYRASDLF